VVYVKIKDKPSLQLRPGVQLLPRGAAVPGVCGATGPKKSVQRGDLPTLVSTKELQVNLST
jgi:hypothetical protein